MLCCCFSKEILLVLDNSPENVVFWVVPYSVFTDQWLVVSENHSFVLFWLLEQHVLGGMMFVKVF